MFDNVCRFLAESFTPDFAQWLLKEAIPLTRLNPSELSLEPIRADALILLESQEIVLHLEFQTEVDPEMPFRMLDYRLRVYRRYPRKQMRQVVIYLKQTGSELVRQNTFVIPGTRHEFELIRLWEQPQEVFLQSPGLLPLAVLSRTENRVRTLAEVARRIEGMDKRREQSNVAASTAILAALVLEKETISRLLRQEIMRESVIYQEIEASGMQTLLLRQLKRRIGELDSELESHIRGLSVMQLQELGEALLDFAQKRDLLEWLETH